MTPNQLRDLLREEQETQSKQWLNSNTSLKEQRSKGIIIHPIVIDKKRFGYGDYPIIQFSCSYEVNGSNFKNGNPVALFSSKNADESCNGNLLYFHEGKGEILLFSDDFPEFVNGSSIGIRAIPDTKTFDLMHGVLKKIEKKEDNHLTTLFEYTIGQKKFETPAPNIIKKFFNSDLNPSQKKAVEQLTTELPIGLLHGPPGTGKTTTLIEVTLQLLKNGKKIAVCAPSNAAVDHFANSLLKHNISIFRIGNTAKVNQAVWEYTIEGILAKDEFATPLKKLKIRASEYRKLANQYKRNFGHNEREQRKLLFKEWKALKDEIKKTSDYSLEKTLDTAQVVIGTPVGLRDSLLKNKAFDVTIIDEAGQCMTPLAWVGLQNTERFILGGDPFQLPPTVIDFEAGKKGLNTSILEQCFDTAIPICFLDVQYRMPPVVADFSSNYFYKGELKSFKSNKENELQIQFFDTAGADFREEFDEGTTSLKNSAELNFVQNLLEKKQLNVTNCIFISPYASQVKEAKSLFPEFNKISTIDAFQGQEADTVILSLVRSNEEGKIGFLSDYRRMNVALTRVINQLFIIGDSSTIGMDEFYEKLLSYIEEVGGYHSVFEYLYE